MNEIPQNRSPRSPAITLQDSLAFVRKLHQQARGAAVQPDTAVKAMGYKGINGTALETLGTLTQYGLIDRKGGAVMVTPLAVRILHPLSDEKRAEALAEAAMLPKVFSEMLSGFEEASEDLVANTLIHNNFTEERARKVAQVYTANRAFVPSLSTDSKENKVEPAQESAILERPKEGNAPAKGRQEARPFVTSTLQQDVLATYRIPLGTNEAELTFTGEKLAVEDFEALADFVEFAKKQFERKLRAQQATSEPYTFEGMGQE